MMLRPILLSIAMAAIAPVSPAPAASVTLPQEAPVPYPRPATPRPAPASLSLPANEAACRRDLDRLKVAYTPAAPVKAPGACSLPHPLKVTALSPHIAVAPAAIINCQTARAAALLMQTTGQKTALAHLGAPIARIRNASGYVCRRRNGQKRLSEHAYGNALDISRFTLSDGRRIDVRSYRASAERKFLKSIQSKACGIFKTVLGPGSDADHADHFHFDMRERSNGSTWCK
ncbi:extensin family protein [Nitratireductor basaltis]|uniref:Extensin-like protein n=1 Tax=Nitratireductor basaltis TaxID=472175 RepID=A0A084U998_9HYPH|nr:extensin family protein [Nitratireductor basaltis]KFB09534.1 Extensin-like protein [Nitratireductor basaltis]